LKRNFLLLITFIFLNLMIWPEESFSYMKHYQKVKPREYTFAINTMQQLYDNLSEQKYKYALEASVIVFPELLRYSAFRDELETLANELKSYAPEESDGYSIGFFQMKPIFALRMEKLIALDLELKTKYPLLLIKDSGTSDDRIQRINRLQDWTYQLEYLKAFCDFEIKRLKLEKEDLIIRIKYLATAYNANMFYTREKLDKWAEYKTFPGAQKDLYFKYSEICIEAAGKVVVK